MKLTTNRRQLMVGAAATLAMPAFVRRVNAQSAVRIAGIHASPVENAWNSRIHLAMQEAAASGLIEYEFSEGVAATDYPRAMRQYAEGGADIVWGESYAVEREAREVAGDYPDTAFLMGSSGGPEGDNFGVFGTRNHEAAYLAGMLAGRMSESNVFGSVGGYPIPSVVEAASDLGARLAPIDGEAAAALVETYPFFSADLIPGGVYAGVGPTPTLAVVAQWLVDARLDEALVHDICRALWHPTARALLDGGHAKGRQITLETALDGAAIPLHPGAERYYKEKGLL